MRHDLRWMTPSARWPSVGADGAALMRPALLGFDSDDFMDRLTAHLDPPPDAARRPRSPGTLEGFLLRWESGRLPPAGHGPSWRPTPPPGAVPRLFQPAHGRFYMVAASLVCRVPGMPDHKVELSRGERVGFVLRRVLGGEEFAWVPSPDAERRGWRRVDANPARLLDGEEVVPMFPVKVAAVEGRRRMWAGLLPTASRETWRDGRPQPVEDPEPGDDARLAEPRALVRQGLEALKGLENLPDGTIHADDLPDFPRAADAQALCWLVDLADLLQRNLPDVWSHLTLGAPALSGDALALADQLAPIAGMLQNAWTARAMITGEGGGPAPDTPNRTTIVGLNTETLDQTILAALREAGAGDGDIAVEVPRFEVDPETEHQYVVRCVLQRHFCTPPHPDVVSARTDAFEVASFFDADAPARPIRISLPVDISVAALRKSPRSVAFIFSKQLRAQMARVSSARGLIDEKFKATGSLDLGEICSLSIPIITIVAIILLFAIVLALNFVFWWLPFVKVCFPIPRRGP